MLTAIGYKVLASASVKVPPEDAQDIIRDTVMDTFDDKTLLKFDPARIKSGIAGYVGGIFKNRMFNALKKWIREHKNQVFVNDEENDKPSWNAL